MNSDAPSPVPVPGDGSSDSIRRQVVDAAAELIRGVDGFANGRGSGSSGQTAMNLYLALLTDRLPVYARTITNLGSRVGQASVEENLFPIAKATVQFYGEVLAAKLNVFGQPDQLLKLRHVLKSRGLGPTTAHRRVAAYLHEERELGRISSDVDCETSARLLIGACVNYAFTKILLDEAEPLEVFAEQTVRGLRLTS